MLRAVARDAQVVVMDEPTAASTTEEAEQLFGIVRWLHERGTTVIYVSHFLAEVLELSDTVTVLRDGKVVRTSASADETPERLVSAMLGRTIELTFPEKKRARADAPVVLSVREPAAPAGRQRCLVRDSRGRDPRTCRADRQRPLGAGARGLRRGPA